MKKTPDQLDRELRTLRARLRRLKAERRLAILWQEEREARGETAGEGRRP